MAEIITYKQVYLDHHELSKNYLLTLQPSHLLHILFKKSSLLSANTVQVKPNKKKQ